MLMKLNEFIFLDFHHLFDLLRITTYFLTCSSSVRTFLLCLVEHLQAKLHEDQSKHGLFGKISLSFSLISRSLQSLLLDDEAIGPVRYVQFAAWFQFPGPTHASTKVPNNTWLTLSWKA